VSPLENRKLDGVEGNCSGQGQWTIAVFTSEQQLISIRHAKPRRGDDAKTRYELGLSFAFVA